MSSTRNRESRLGDGEFYFFEGKNNKNRKHLKHRERERVKESKQQQQ